MKISEIYKKYAIPPNLAEHMITVSKVIIVLQKHWKEGYINWDEMVTIGLLHDIGNIVKFKFGKYSDLFGYGKQNINRLKKIQKEFIEKYGSDDHAASKKILEEIGVNNHMIEIILNKSFGNIVSTLKSNVWSTKILMYADLRVLPRGIVSIDERIEDVKERMPNYTIREDFPELVKASYGIEEQIQEMSDIPLSSISSEIGNIHDDQLLLRNIGNLHENKTF